MTYFVGISQTPFTNHLKQTIQPNSKVLIATSTNGVTVREGVYLGMRNNNPVVVASYKSGKYDMNRFFEHKSGKVYAA